MLRSNRGLGSLGAGEDGLAKAFNTALNLKRKISDSPERGDKGKKQKNYLFEEVEKLGQEKVLEGGGLDGQIQRAVSHNRAKTSRGRDRRGGKSLGGLDNGGNIFLVFSEGDLVDVEVNCGESLGGGSTQALQRRRDLVCLDQKGCKWACSFGGRSSFEGSSSCQLGGVS
ncbi:hypothetical protein RHMOL_Rhmol07G0184400 [Rhododendron molle]|uniref:Uncharacterized protein n=1 Tax=Rhododendron molle TaxID=49168 RepID=A0ACC0N3P1_RHOML|nr:hypothetical protein RHMOL_Rhmol07G0184400 [Rhododendron molle]